MQLRLPSPPRQVALKQVPGACFRLGLTAAMGVGVVLVLWLLSLEAGKYLSKEADFFVRAAEVEGQVVSVKLPPERERAGGEAKLSVIYNFQEVDHSASGVATAAEYAEGLGQGAKVSLLVDPKQPSRPREKHWARASEEVGRFAPLGLGLGVLLALGFFAFEFRRAVTKELEPLRNGIFVWLTPDGPVPETKKETTFAAHYFRQDVKHSVKARARPGRAPVRNNDKLLAAVVPSKPSWVRVIDEDLARQLGWFG